MESVETDGRNGLRGHKPGKIAKYPTVFPARQRAMWRACLSQLRQSVHIRMMTKKRSKGNPDPSRMPVPGAAGIRVAGRGDRAVLPGSVDGADWHVASDDAGLGPDRPRCNSVVRDHNSDKERKSPGTRCAGKSVISELPRHDRPSVLAGGTRQRSWLRGNLKPAFMWLPDKAAIREPRRFRRRGSSSKRRLRSNNTTSLCSLDDNRTRIVS